MREPRRALEDACDAKIRGCVDPRTSIDDLEFAWSSRGRNVVSGLSPMPGQVEVMTLVKRAGYPANIA